MSDKPMIVKAEPLENIPLADSMKTLNEVEELLAFVSTEWREASAYLTELGYPTHVDDEFMKMEDRIRMAVDGK